MKETGPRDIPAEQDKLGLESYAQGLAHFIQECATPMTLSIQGDWGSGKTSLFNLTRNHLKSQPNIVDVIEVNTWQFSVAGYQDGLVNVLIGEVLGELSKLNEAKAEKFKANIIKGLKFLRNGAWAYFTNTAYEQEALEADQDGLIEASQKVKKLKSNLEEMVESYRGEKGDDARLVVFIDDLDRLEPENAVTLMEGIKNFLDCEGCVFVLAIDEKVVFEGIKKKYGENIGEQRKQAFFDKLIQVPFSIPQSAYDLKPYVEDLLKESEKGYADDCANVIRQLVPIGNPRSIKRYFNRARLHRAIIGDGGVGSITPMLLAAIVILLEDPDAFSVLAEFYSESGSNDELAKALSGNRIEWESINALLKGSSPQQTIERRQEFGKCLSQLKRTQDASPRSILARIRSVAVSQQGLEEFKEKNQEEVYLFKTSESTKALRVNVLANRVNVTIYEDALSPKKWEEVTGKLLTSGNSWHFGKSKNQQRYATRVVTTSEEDGKLFEQLKQYFSYLDNDNK